MASSTRWRGVVIASSWAALALAVPRAPAQNPFFQVRPGLTLQQYRALAQVPPYAYGYNPYGLGTSPYATLATNPYGAATMTANPYGSVAGYESSPYAPGYPYNYYNYDPYGGYLRGGADVINAQGRFLVSRQQANLVYEQVRAERIANRRRVFDEYLYERERMPTLQQERERSLQQQRERSRNDPPITEIWSGKALNDLLGDVQQLRAKGNADLSKAPQIPVDEDVLKHINVASKDGGNIGLLKNEGQLAWPVALSGADAKVERERLTVLAEKAVGQARFQNKVDPGTLKEMSNDLEELQKLLRKNVGDLPPSQYIEARRFLNNFEDALRQLAQPNPGGYVTRKWAADLKNVSDLVDRLLSSGLQFAPAVAGDEAAYVSLHRALAHYDIALNNQVAAGR